MDILAMTALEIGQAIKEKRLTVREAVMASLEAIREKDGVLSAFLTVDEEKALKQADIVQADIDAGRLTGPLAGVPIAIKDNICTKGMRTTCASKILGDFDPPYNATVIDKLEMAGMVVVGKTNMDEFAMGSTSETSYYGISRNPFDTNKVPGGSSGGSAVAVASREVPCALGSDTGGSVRQPASYCGVTGLKSTYGTVSRFGLIAYASSLDQIGPIARDVADCAALLDIIAGKDKMDGTSLELGETDYLSATQKDIRGMKVGLPRECFSEGLDPDVKASILTAVETLKGLGAIVEEVSLPFLDFVIPTYYIIACAEASSNLSRFDGVKYGFRAEGYDDLTDLYCKTRSEGFGEEVKKRILLGTFVLSSGYYDAYYRKALKTKAIIKQHFDKIYAEYDLILCPTAPTTAPKIGESLSDTMKMYLSDIYTVSANIAGLPAMSVPCGVDKSGMPIGMQLLAKPLDEKHLFALGHAFQQATDFHKIAPNAPTATATKAKEVDA